MTRFEPILAYLLQPGDQYKVVKYEFAPIYTLDYFTTIGAHGHCVRQDGSMHYDNIGHFETVYKLVEV